MLDGIIPDQRKVIFFILGCLKTLPVLLQEPANLYEAVLGIRKFSDFSDLTPAKLEFFASSILLSN